MTNWLIYRHRAKPDIRLYVECGEDGEPILYHGTIHCKGVWNCRFDEANTVPEMASNAGDWLAKSFLELYTPETPQNESERARRANGEAAREQLASGPGVGANGNV